MNLCKKCYKPTTKGNLCDDCQKKEAQLQSAKIQVKKVLTTLEHGEYHNYLVYQGKTFFTEIYHGIIWAPIQNSKGQTFHHWTRLKDLKIGDRIFHCVNGKIEAISTVEKETIIQQFPDKVLDDEKYEGKGYCVECNYVRYHKPLELYYYRDKTKKLGQYIYSPFNKNGEGCEGYLFPLCDELADLFDKEIHKFNY